MRCYLFFALSLFFISGKPAHAQLRTVQTLEEYNHTLIDFGVSWKSGKDIYFPSFYTGFAPKVEDANHIHFHLGRGNQARLTAALDEKTILVYLYNLQARAIFYNTLLDHGIIAPVGQDQMGSFQSILSSEVYGIQKAIADFEAGHISRTAFYNMNLDIMKRLNPGRVFQLSFDLRSQFLTWKEKDFAKIAALTHGQDQAAIQTKIAKNNDAVIVALNNMLPGRINLSYLNELTASTLANLIASASRDSDDLFVEKSLVLFHQITFNRFQFRVVQQDRWEPATNCHFAGSCQLTFFEFTAIYPVGSVKSYTKDRDGNKIPDVAEVGSMNFIDRSYHDVDHIRSEGFYGWMPKMDYTSSGNGIHNPAVRTDLSRTIYQWLYKEFDIPSSDNTLWVVARGGVSHGCTRMAAGHIQEVRQIFPSNPKEMMKLVYTGNHPSDYDLFDIDGDGQLEVMGVDYLIAYALDSDSGAGYREGNGFIDEALKKTPFYQILYGKKQFTLQTGNYIFANPYMSYFTKSSQTARAKALSVRIEGQFALYEQAYEKDKIQFINLPKLKVSSLLSGVNTSNKTQQLIRLYGRVNSCGPFKQEFPSCPEDAFQKEFNSLLQKIN